ncbi:MAG: hypothetical protein MPN21_15375 [Thermoanaerobaculia bacterium]|nr:hypothetical protein [Thermoanaerobaculia bacterium]
MAPLKRLGGSKRDRRGTSLFETVIALLLFSMLILGLSMVLLTEAGRRLQHSGLRAEEVAGGRVLDRIRTDVWGSRTIVMPLDYDPLAFWYEGPLVLSGHWSGYEMAYGVTGDVLYRITRRPGDEPEIAEVLRGIGRFRWRFLDVVGRSTVELEILRTETTTFRGGYGGPSRTSVADRVVLLPRRVQASRW